MKKKQNKTKRETALLGPPESEIAARAYFYWIEEGCPDGAEWRHWLRAEVDLIAEMENRLEREG
jgi:hypothetical protein